MREVVEKLQVFLLKQYKQKVVPTLEEAFQKPFDDIPIQEVPKLSLVVVGSRLMSTCLKCGPFLYHQAPHPRAQIYNVIRDNSELTGSPCLSL